LLKICRIFEVDFHSTTTTPNEKMSAQNQDRPSSAGSIKRNKSKISAEGLIVLPPEPGHVKFESVSVSRPSSSADYLSGTRTGSAGRLERSLQLARKKELEDEFPRRNSAGADLSSALGDLKLKQEERKVTPPEQTDEDSSESSDTESSDSDEKSPATSASAAEEATVAEAPVELKGEFLRAVMDEEYEKAKELCQKILLLEPDNKTCSEFHAVICEKMKQDEEEEDRDDSDDSEESDDEDESDDDKGDEGDKDDDDDEDDDNDDDDNESDSDDDVTLPPGPINLIMGGLPIRPQSR